MAKAKRSKTSKTIKNNSKFSNFMARNRRWVFGAVFALAGISFLVITYALTPPPRYQMNAALGGISVQMEGTRLEGPAKVIDDYRATGGKAVNFGKVGFTSQNMGQSTQKALLTGCDLDNTSLQLPRATFEVVVPGGNGFSADVLVRYKETTALKQSGMRYYVQVNDAKCAASAEFVSRTRFAPASQNWEVSSGATVTSTFNLDSAPAATFTLPTKVVDGVRRVVKDDGSLGGVVANNPTEYAAAKAFVAACAVKTPQGPCPGISVPSLSAVGLQSTFTSTTKPRLQPGINKIAIYTSGGEDVQIDSIMVADGVRSANDAKYKAIFADTAQLAPSDTSAPKASQPVDSAPVTTTTTSSSSSSNGSSVVNISSDSALSGNPVAAQQTVDTAKFEQEQAQFASDVQAAAKATKPRNILRRSLDNVNHFFRSIRNRL